MPTYNLLNTIATYLLLVYNLLHYKKKRELLSGPSHAAMRHFQAKGNFVAKVLAKPFLWTILEIGLISSLQYIYVGFLNAGLGNLLKTGANYFGIIYFAPLLVFAFCLAVRIDPLAQMDLITPAYPLALTLVKISCFVTGCCGGIAWVNGKYNPVTRRIEFPAQLLESAVAFALFLFLTCFKKKFKKGTIFPIYLTVYSALRFCTEFFRSDPNVLCGLKTYHFLCIIGVILGVTEYIAVRKYDARMQSKKIEEK